MQYIVKRGLLGLDPFTQRSTIGAKRRFLGKQFGAFLFAERLSVKIAAKLSASIREGIRKRWSPKLRREKKENSFIKRQREAREGCY